LKNTEKSPFICFSLSLFQNPVGFEQAPGKPGQKPGFSVKSKEAVPITEALEQPPLTLLYRNTRYCQL
jgi:hypothetical protein